VKGKEARECAWGGGGGVEEGRVGHLSATEEDPLLSQEGGRGLRPQDFCPEGAVWLSWRSWKTKGIGWDAANKPLDAVQLPTGS